MRSLRSRLARLSKGLPNDLLKASSRGLVDQGIISGTNFIVMVVAARELGPSGFGIFAILLTVLLLMETTQRSLITTPHNVLGVHREKREYPAYTGTIVIAQCSMAIILATATLLAAIVAIQFNRELGALVAATGLAAFGWQMHEFSRRVLYTESRIGAALIADLIAYPGRLLVVSALLMGRGLTGASLMTIYGLTWVCGAAAGFWLIRRSIAGAFQLSVLQEHWSFGRWLLASNATAQLPSFAIAALLSSTLSVAVYGAHRAFEQLANSTNVPLSGMSNVLRPRIARQARSDPGAA